MRSSTHLILRMAVACFLPPPNASGSGSDEFQWPRRLSGRPLQQAALFRFLPAGPMHRAFQRLDQFVFFNVIAAPVAFQTSVEYPRGVQVPEFERDGIYILHRIFTCFKNVKGLP